VLTGVTSCFADSGLQCQPGVEVKFPELTRATALGSAVLVLRADTQHQCYTSNAVAMHDVTMEGMDTASSLMSPGAGTSPPKEGGDVACRSIRTAPGTPTGRASAAPWVVLVSITDRAPKIQTRIASVTRVWATSAYIHRSTQTCPQLLHSANCHSLPLRTLYRV
jgi:hypothetical protein